MFHAERFAVLPAGSPFSDQPAATKYQAQTLISEQTDFVDTQPSAIIYTTVPFTEILREIFEAFYATRSKRLRSDLTSNFDERLHQWKEGLPPCLRFEDSRPIQGWAIDQKMILKLRFYNAQILLHRPFLPLVQLSDPDNVHRKHLDVCVDAARNTLLLLHISYTHRPYLQNWWYHITYILYASTTIAYALFLDISGTTRQELLKDVEISIVLLRYMDTVSVAQKCMRLIENVVEMSHPSAVDRVPPRGLFATDGEVASRTQSRLERMNQNEYEVLDDVSTHQPESLTGHAINLSTQQPPGRLERDLLLPFDSKELDCLIDADILKLLSDSPVSFAGNFETQDFLACDDCIFQDALGGDV
ncbi:hypothetical protein N7528_006467 [Penicillium herquei]|nr:hypothetical protein N7528_006467 [Penicillium herquei]